MSEVSCVESNHRRQTYISVFGPTNIEDGFIGQHTTMSSVFQPLRGIHFACAIGVRYCKIESNEEQGIPRYCKKVCRNRLGIICDLWSCQCVQWWLNSNADMMHTVIICLKWWPILWAHRQHAYMDITSSRRCGLTRRNISKLSTTHRCLFQFVDYVHIPRRISGHDWDSACVNVVAHLLQK